MTPPLPVVALQWPGGTLDRLIWTVAALFAILATLLLLLALFRDRSRGRARCPRCFYDLRDLAADQELPTCPECGKTPKRRQALFKTRRRWRRAAVAVAVLLVAGALALTPRVREHGIYSIIPTTALLVLVPDAGEEWLSNGSLHWAAQELERREAHRTIWDWQWTWFVRAKGVVSWREKWPESQPVIVRVTSPSWTPFVICQRSGDQSLLDSLAAGVRITAGPHAAKVLQARHDSWGSFGDDVAWEVMTATLNGWTLPNRSCLYEVADGPGRFAIEIVTADGASNCRLALTVEPVRELQHVVTPVDVDLRASAALGFASARLSSLRLGRGFEQTLSLKVHLDRLPPALRDACHVLRATIFFEGEELHSLLLQPQPYFGPDLRGEWEFSLIDIRHRAGDNGSLGRRIRQDSQEIRSGTRDEHRWFLVLHGDPIASIRHIRGHTYWSGSVTIPLADVLERR